MKLIGLYYKKGTGVLCGYVAADNGTAADLQARARTDEAVIVVSEANLSNLHTIISSLGLKGTA